MKAIPKKPLLNENLIRPGWRNSIARDIKHCWLDKNENLDPVLAYHNNSLLSQIKAETLGTYPEFGPLYKKLANWVGVSPDCLMLAPGSDGVIRLVFEAFVGEGDVVVHTRPTFAMYPIYCQMFGAEQVSLDYQESNDGPVLPIEEVLEKIRLARPKLFCLPNPDSPTGTAFSRIQIKSILETCAEVGAMALIDEAYHPFYAESCVELIGEFENLIVARTFAKAWGLAGLRIGYAVGHPETIQYLHKLRPMYEVSTIAGSVLELALETPCEMEKSVFRLEQGKAFFLNAMRNLGYKTLNGNGNFLHVNFGSNSAAVHNALDNKVLYRKDFAEPSLQGFSRFSSTTIEIFEPIIELIKNASA